MSEQNIDVVRRAARAMNEGDAEAAVGLMRDDVVFEPLRSATEGAYLGHQGVRDFFTDTAAAFDLFQITADYQDIGDDQVLVTGTLRVRGRGSGAETETTTAALATVKDGLLIRFTDYGDEKLARAALAHP